jgi:hypothetical protein
MASKTTSTFYLTERLTITAANTPVTATIDLGAYVDVADRQAVMVEEVDFIVQGTTASTTLTTSVGGDAQVDMQISDLNRGGTIQFADDRALVASGQLLVDYSNNSVTNSSDMFPDVFGARDGVRIVVNDQMYLTAESSAVAGSNSLNVIVRVKCHIGKLKQADWMAFKRLAPKYRKKGGGWKKDGFKRCAAAARKVAKK